MKDISKSIVILILTEIFHLIINLILGIIFYILCFNTQNILHDLIISIKYLINLTENINNIFNYSINLVVLHHNKYTNLYVSRELFSYSTREKLMYYYK